MFYFTQILCVAKMCDKDDAANGEVSTQAEPLQLKRNIGLVSGVAYIAGMIIGDDVISTVLYNYGQMQ